MSKLLMCRVGPYAGHLIEYREDVAENLLQNGLAELPTDEEYAAYYGAEVEVETKAPPPPEKKTPGKKRKKKA